MFIVAGAPALSSFKQRQLLSRLANIATITAVDSQFLYFFDTPLDDRQLKAAVGLLNDGQTFVMKAIDSGSVQVLVTPRLGTVSPWSSKATDIFSNCDVPIHRLERGTLYTLHGTSHLSKELKAV